MRTSKPPFGSLLPGLPANSSCISHRAVHARLVGSISTSFGNTRPLAQEFVSLSRTNPLQIASQLFSSETLELPGTVSVHIPRQSMLPPLPLASGVTTTIRSSADGPSGLDSHRA